MKYNDEQYIAPFVSEDELGMSPAQPIDEFHLSGEQTSRVGPTVRIQPEHIPNEYKESSLHSLRDGACHQVIFIASAASKRCAATINPVDTPCDGFKVAGDFPFKRRLQCG